MIIIKDYYQIVKYMWLKKTELSAIVNSEKQKRTFRIYFSLMGEVA